MTITIKLSPSASGNYRLTYTSRDGSKLRLSNIQPGDRPGFIVATAGDKILQLAVTGNHGLTMEEGEEQ